MKDDTKKEIIVTIASTIVLATITIFMGIIGMKKEVKETIVYVPQLESVNFPEYFGLKKGKIFNYSVSEKEAVPNKGPEYTEVNYAARVKVLDEIKGDRATLFILDNDIMFPTRNKVNTGILFIGNQVYTLKDNEIELYQEMTKGDMRGFDRMKEKQPTFILPFFNGQRFDEDTRQLFRKDCKYQYVVNKESFEVSLSQDKIIQQPRYKIAYVTLPDETFHTFVPGRGFTEISYHHNGSVSEYWAFLDTIEYLQND